MELLNFCLGIPFCYVLATFSKHQIITLLESLFGDKAKKQTNLSQMSSSVNEFSVQAAESLRISHQLFSILLTFEFSMPVSGSYCICHFCQGQRTNHKQSKGWFKTMIKHCQRHNGPRVLTLNLNHFSGRNQFEGGVICISSKLGHQLV